MLVKKNILKDNTDKTYCIFTNYITSNFLRDKSLPRTMAASDYVKECWARYKNNASPATYEENNSLNGRLFEVIIVTALYRKGIRPFYYQAGARLVPDVDYDIIMYDKDEDIPITISVKTSSRERYKQADLEAYAFKNVHRRSLNYLIMLNPKDCTDVQKKIDNEMTLGLKSVIQADTKAFDDLVDDLKKRKLSKSPKIELFFGQTIT